MELGNMMGGFYKASVWVLRFLLTNLIWLLFNFPIVLVGMNFLSADLSDLLVLTLTIAVLAPFILFPATTALFGVVRKWVMGDAEVPIFSTFLTCYKENYLRSVLGGVVFALVWIGWAMNYYLFVYQNPGLAVVIYSLFTMILFTWTIYFFSYNVHFEVPFLTSVKNSFILAVGRPFSVLGVVMVNGVIIYISTTLTFLFPFFVGSITAFLSFMFFYRLAQKAVYQQSAKRIMQEL